MVRDATKQVNSISAWNARIFGCKNQRDWRNALGILSFMSAQGVNPSLVSFNAALETCGRAGQVDAAFFVLEQIWRYGLQADVVTFTSLINACSRVHQVDRAFAVLYSMNEWGVSPNCITYNALLHACACCGDYERAWHVYVYMHAKNITPSTFKWNVLTREWSKLGYPWDLGSSSPPAQDIARINFSNVFYHGVYMRRSNPETMFEAQQSRHSCDVQSKRAILPRQTCYATRGPGFRSSAGMKGVGSLMRLKEEGLFTRLASREREEHLYMCGSAYDSNGQLMEGLLGHSNASPLVENLREVEALSDVSFTSVS